MTRRIVRSVSPFRAALGLSLLVALPTSPAWALPRTYYVDYQAGNDANSGLAPGAPWKHAPGDARSTGASRSLTLGPGDRLLFKGGTRYRGGFTLRAAGVPGNPVTVEGSGWGTGRAIFDGSDDLTGVRRCRSAADCLDSPHWQKLWRADLPMNAAWFDWLFVNDTALMPASYPAMSDADAQDREKYLTYSRESAPLVLACNIPHALPAGLNTGTPVIAMWVKPNKIAFGDNIQVGTSGVNVTGARWVHGEFDPYCDRTGNFALMNLPAMVSRPGLFAMSPKDRVVIFYPVSANAVPRASIGGRRHGINLARTSNTVIRGFQFSNFGGDETSTYAGSALLATSGRDGITISDNLFKSIASIPRDTHAVFLNGSSNVRVEYNEFTNIRWSPAMTMGNMPGPGSIKCNRFSHLGGSGFRVQNSTGVSIVGNDIRFIYGVHANGMSAYMDNRDMLIADNVVIDAHRPLTVGGTATPWPSPGTPRILVTRNVFVSPDDSDAAVSSWGQTRGLHLIGNDLSNPRFALKLLGDETDLKVSGNRMVGGIAVGNKAPLVEASANQMFEPSGNGSLLTAEMRAATVKPEVCARN